MKEKPYFKNLNSLRFIAALLVVIHHIEVYNPSFKVGNLYDNFVLNVGKLSVVFFFVLSGFLITYLLLQEKENKQDISVRIFYQKRIFRIWPVYYMVIIFGFFLHQHFYLCSIPGISRGFDDNFKYGPFFLYLLFLPNIAFVRKITAPYTEQCWSIGVEEQFYIIWPWVIKYSRNLKNTLVIILFASLFLKTIVYFFFVQTSASFVFDFVNLFCLSSLVIGSLTAYIVFIRHEQLCKVLNLGVQKGGVLFVLICLFLGIKFGIYTYDVYSIFFAFIILIAINERSVIKLEMPIFNYLGKISYGIYMYHLIALEVSRKVIHRFEFDSKPMLYLSTIVLTLILSSLSYELLERKIMEFGRSVRRKIVIAA